jgi:hypothetical protein
MVEGGSDRAVVWITQLDLGLERWEAIGIVFQGLFLMGMFPESRMVVVLEFPVGPVGLSCVQSLSYRVRTAKGASRCSSRTLCGTLTDIKNR